MKKKEKFADIMDVFKFQYDLRTVFDDFLTISICYVTRHPYTGLSYYENQYKETIAKYPDEKMRGKFALLFDALADEMTERLNDTKGNDVLGEYFEKHFANVGKMGQFFTPKYICDFMCKSTYDEVKKEEGVPLRILDPACGSGRFFMSAVNIMGREHEYYAIDIDMMCVKMTAINFFLSSIFNSEVMCANALLDGDFTMSYYISFKPIGIWKIEQKEKSRLWNLMRLALKANRQREADKKKVFTEFRPVNKDDTFANKTGSQTSMF